MGRTRDWFFLLGGRRESTSDRDGVARLPLEFGLFHSPRISAETHTHHPHTRHTPPRSLSLSSCEHSLVSRFLSVASLVSCLSCISCLLSVLFCFCLASVLCLSCLVFVFPLSVSVWVSVPVCVCLYICLCLSQRASGKKVNAWIRAPATARDLESASRKSTSVGPSRVNNA